MHVHVPVVESHVPIPEQSFGQVTEIYIDTILHTLCLKWTSTLNLMIRKKWYNIKSGFPKTGKESLNDLKIG